MPDREALRRLTATPNYARGKQFPHNYPGAITVWVEPGTLWLRTTCPVENPDAVDREGWARLTEEDWHRLRDCVDRYFKALHA